MKRRDFLKQASMAAVGASVVRVGAAQKRMGGTMRTALMVVLLGSVAIAQQPAANYDEAKVPAYQLPALLVMSRRLASAQRGGLDGAARGDAVAARVADVRPGAGAAGERDVRD